MATIRGMPFRGLTEPGKSCGMSWKAMVARTCSQAARAVTVVVVDLRTQPEARSW